MTHGSRLALVDGGDVGRGSHAETVVEHLVPTSSRGKAGAGHAQAGIEMVGLVGHLGKAASSVAHDDGRKD